MDIKNYNPHVKREVDFIIIEALRALYKAELMHHAQYIIEVIPILAKEYYPDFFAIKKSDDLGIH